MIRRPTVTALALLALSSSSSCGPPERQDWEDTFTGTGEDAFLIDEDFVCLADDRFDQVGLIRIWNALDHQTESVAVAESEAEGSYPIGTVISLLPVEAMVKRGAGFSPATNDWEFFTFHLDTRETIITARGTTEMNNPGGTCMSCHEPAKDFDLVCATNDRCAPLPFFIDTDVDPATEDPRCGG